MSLRLVGKAILKASLCAAGLSFQTSPLFAEISPSEISITTFNIKYYGLDGDHDAEPGSETRDATIKAHMSRYNLWTDVLVFQEIVDVAGLSALMGRNYLCQSYDNEDPRHQHVVICHKKKFTFKMARDENNFIIDDVAMDRYRPAVHGVLHYKGRPLLHVFGVHLKAQPDQSAIRTEQTNIIADYLRQRENNEPVVIIGDFNTHKDDVTVMSAVYREPDVNLVQADFNHQFTYRVPQHGAKLDRIWVSKGLRVSQAPKVAGPCNSNAQNTSAIRTYNTQVSDHCPVTLKVAVSTSRQ